MEREPCSGTRKGAARVSAAANTSNAPAGGAQEHLDRLAIVVVTYKRQELLSRLFDSFATLTQAPWRIIVIDNDSSYKRTCLLELALVVSKKSLAASCLYLVFLDRSPLAVTICSYYQQFFIRLYQFH